MFTKPDLFKVKIRFLQFCSVGVDRALQYHRSGRQLVDRTESGVILADVRRISLITENVAMSILGGCFKIRCEGLLIQLEHLFLHLLVRDSFFALLFF